MSIGVIMNKKRIYKTYSPAFKREAVTLVIEQNYSVSEAATALNVNPNLYHSVKFIWYSW